MGEDHVFSVLYWQYPFWGIFRRIIQSSLHQMKFGKQSNSKVQNLIRILTFSFLDQKNLFRVSLDQKLKFFQFKVNFGTLTNMQYSIVMLTLSVLDSKYPFWANLIKQNQNYFFRLKCGTQTSSNGEVHFYRRDPFLVNIVQQLKILCLN